MFCNAYLWGGPTKKIGVGLFQISQKRDFFISYDNQVFLGVISQYGPPSCNLQKRPSSPLQFGEKENMPKHLIESVAYWFIWKTARIFPILTSTNTMMNTFIIVNTGPTCQGITQAVFEIGNRFWTHQNLRSKFDELAKNINKASLRSIQRLEIPTWILQHLKNQNSIFNHKRPLVKLLG